MKRSPNVHWLSLLLWTCILFYIFSNTSTKRTITKITTTTPLFVDGAELFDYNSYETPIPMNDGPSNLREGHRLYQNGDYDRASLHYWRAVLFQEENKNRYTVEDAFGSFLRCYAIRGRTADGFVFVAKESIRRGQGPMAKIYIERALDVDPDHLEALELKEIVNGGMPLSEAQLLQNNDDSGTKNTKNKKRSRTTLDDDDDYDYDDNPTSSSPNSRPLQTPKVQTEKTAEDYYEEGTQHFADKSYARAASAFETSCQMSNGRLGVACTNAVYCRTNILDWGDHGTGFDRDMKIVEGITLLEVGRHRNIDTDSGAVSWSRSTSSHPHMMLGYPVNSTLKRYVAESYAAMDEMMARIDPVQQKVNDLPSDLPYHPVDERAKFIFESVEQKDNYRIRVGFVASGFNSKAVLYLSHDMFRFFDPDAFEIHIFSLGPPDNVHFITNAMRGVDWRERVRAHSDYFHDLQYLKDDHIGLARFIHQHNIHILIEWDGYARQGERAQGLFALRPAPVQILHQEFLGTSGAFYVDYIVTDEITSPSKLSHLYTEQFMYMPNHFFSKGHAMQKEVRVPTLYYTPAERPYRIGTGSPIENRCLSNPNVGPTNPSFVFCNFNKFLKNNPTTVRSWIHILRSVPDSMLCLLENPTEGIPYMRKFVKEIAEEMDDGDELNSRIHFLPWQANPFDHQARNQDFCSVMLDSHPYNGHTVAQDALYGGVPIVTRSDGDDMSSRVTTSANIVLGLDELNAYGGSADYESIAIRLGSNSSWYDEIRTKLIGTARQRDPMHPYWDVPRYVRNFETGLKMAWDAYLGGSKLQNIHVMEDEISKGGTYKVDVVQRSKARKAKLKEQFLARTEL